MRSARSRRGRDISLLLAGAGLGVIAGVLMATSEKDLRRLLRTARRRLRHLQETIDFAPQEELAEDSHGDALVGETDDIDDHLAELEFRVLDVFREDRLLSRRAIEIGALEDGLIELRGRVRSEDEAAHAGTLAKAVEGVETVVNRLRVRPPRDARGRAHRREGDRGGVRSSVVDPADEGGGDTPGARS